MPTTSAHRHAAPRGDATGPRARPPAPAAPGAVPSAYAATLLAAVIAAGALPVLAVWWQDTLPVSLHTPGGYITALGRLTGLLAAYLLLALTALMARIPVIENRVGSDAAARVHRALGEYTVALACCHALLITLGYAQAARTNPVSEAVTLELDYPDVLMSTAALGLLVWIGVVSARAVRAKLAYESWYFIHLYVYLAMALAFSHEFANGVDFSSSPRNRVLWSAAHIAVAALWLLYRVALPAARSARHTLRIARVVPETRGVVSLYLTGRDLDRLRAQPGQFLRLRFLARGHWWQCHPYSLSAAPTARALRVTVKDLGDASRAVARLRPGTRVWFEGPYGAFTARRRRARKVLLIGAGAGITPVRALFETLPGRGADVILLYRAGHHHDLPLYTELEAIARRRGFGLYPLLGPRDAPGGDPLRPEALRAAVPDVAEREVFLCGPLGLTAAASAHLRAAGVPRARIHSEAFEL
jgi:predicted ferric reductase